MEQLTATDDQLSRGTPAVLVAERPKRTHRSGAKLGNTNGVRHGARNARDGKLALVGKLPPGCNWIRTRLSALKNAVLDALDGQPTTYQLCVLQTCLRWEQHVCLCQRALRKNADSFGPETRLAYSREVARGSSERDKCLRELGLARGEPSAIAALYAPQPRDDPEDPAGTERPAEASLEPHASHCGPPVPEDSFDHACQEGQIT